MAKFVRVFNTDKAAQVFASANKGKIVIHYDYKDGQIVRTYWVKY